MSSRSNERNVWIVSSRPISRICDLLPANEGRQSLVTSLIEAFDLHNKCQLVEVGSVSDEDIKSYHTEEFTNCLVRTRRVLDTQCENYTEIKGLIRELNADAGFTTLEDYLYFQPNDEVGENSTEDLEQMKSCQISFDCYAFPFMATYVKLVAATSLSAAKTLISTQGNSTQNIAINWYGGRHHCTKLKAAGYCYVNDIILAIGLLRKSFKRVFYLDLDLHHGDGVESAYKLSKSVFTCSIHRYDVGFYPSSGSLESSGPARINIPTRRGLSDVSMLFILKEIVIPIIVSYSPEVLVVQSGCDGLGTDTHKEWNLTIKGFGEIIRLLSDTFQIPILILGGGGYNHTETAKCWAHVTRTLVGDVQDWDIIPDHDQIDAYEGDSFQFWTHENSKPKNIPDDNDSEYLGYVKKYISSI